MFKKVTRLLNVQGKVAYVCHLTLSMKNKNATVFLNPMKAKEQTPGTRHMGELYIFGQAEKISMQNLR